MIRSAQWWATVIKSFRDKRAQAFFDGLHPGKGFPADLIRPARRRLVMLAEAKERWDADIAAIKPRRMA